MAEPMNRAEEIAANLADLDQRITAACAAAGRDRSEVTLIVVTKTWPASDVRIVADLGQRHVGENRDQEAAPKHDELADLPLTWHAIGQLQTNKAKSVAQWADVVHSVDRLNLVTALGKAVADRSTPLACLIQVNLDAVTGQVDTAEHLAERGGCAPQDVHELAHAIAATPGLRLQGVMGVAPLGQDPAPAFAALHRISQSLQEVFPEATWISAGMSDDLESAVNNGATHLRIGSAVLGHRVINR